MQSCAGVLGVLLVLGCGAEHGGDEPFRIRDTSGAEFFFVAGEVHRITGVSPPLPVCVEEARPVFRFLSQSRFLVVIGGCDFGSGTEWWPRDRIVVCDQDEDCPQRESTAYECRAGFCQDVEAPDYLTWIDMVELCFGHEPRVYVPSQELSFDMLPAPVMDQITDACNVGQALEPCEGELPAECPDPS